MRARMNEIAVDILAVISRYLGTASFVVLASHGCTRSPYGFEAVPRGAVAHSIPGYGSRAVPREIS